MMGSTSGARHRLTTLARVSNNAFVTKQETSSLITTRKSAKPVSAALRSLHGHCPTSSYAVLCAPGPPRRAAAPRRPGLLLYLAQASLAFGHYPHRRLPSRAHSVEHRGAQRTGRVCRPGQVSERAAAGAGAGVDVHFHPHPVSRDLRGLHLAARKVERRLLPLGRELALRFTALDWHYCFHLHHPARAAAAFSGGEPA